MPLVCPHCGPTEPDDDGRCPKCGLWVREAEEYDMVIPEEDDHEC